MKLTALPAVLIIAVSSYGFNSNSPSQINKLLWFDGWFNYYTQLRIASEEVAANVNDFESSNPIESDLNLSDANFPFLTLFADSILTSINPDSIIIHPDSLLKFGLDTTTIFTDSLENIPDSLKPDPRTFDSTARLENFKYKPVDVPYLSFHSRKSPRLIGQPSPNLKKRVIEIDSTGEFVEIKDKIGDQVVKIVLKIPLSDYIELKLKSREQALWDELAYKYELKDTKKGLGDLIKDITDFEIPLPSVGILSIFGTPKINLKIGGAVDIHGAWRNETTEGLTASRLGNSRNEPDFRQQVQINVNGTIGDKLQINADWNTERNFEYENQLKIKYTGYEDEIVQSVEAGNVSLQTSPLVGGGEALFGIKSVFKLGPLNLTVLASQKKGEVKEKSVSGGTQTNEFQIRAYDYSKNHYFLSSLYADTSSNLNLFNRFYGNITPDVDRQFFVKNIEVWKSITQTLRNPNERNAIAYINLQPLIVGQRYADSLRDENKQEIQGEISKGRFILLTQDVDYSLHPETGFITFKTNLQETDVIAVSYQVEGPNFQTDQDDTFFGEFLSQTQQDTSRRLVLKLVKPQNLLPQHKEAWKLLLKNIYPTSGRNINREGFEFDLRYEIDGGEAQNVIGDIKLLNAFGLDRVDASGNPQPDGVFDFKVAQTIYPETGEIIFPYLQPFGRNIPRSLDNADSLRFLDIYDTTAQSARNNKVKDK